MSKQPTDEAALTPLLRQFHAIKAEHPDKILFFRMGDFYEMFGDDAVEGAPILGIALTSRSHGSNERIPLAGVPHHAADRYLARLLAAGKKVVVVEQVEDPKTAKGLVKREIVEILTPGTATVDAVESSQLSSSLAAVYSLNGQQLGLALLDLTTGSFLVDEGEASTVFERLKILDPTEVLYPSGSDQELWSRLTNGHALAKRLTEWEEWNFDFKTAERELNQHFGTTTLAGFGVADDKLATVAAGAIFRYLRENHRDQLLHINRLTKLDQSEYMSLDYSTVRNLELVQPIATGGEDLSLFSVANRCLTIGGQRRLRAALLRPFRSKVRIERRLTGVAELVRNRDLAFRLREGCKQFPDLSRLAGRLGIGKLGPRQMSAIADALKLAAAARTILHDAHSPLLVALAGALPDTTDLVSRIDTALVEEPPILANKGNIFRRGFSEELDGLNDSIKDAREYISSLQQSERERTGINTLKVGFNRVFGYYIEVTRLHSASVPEQYIRKQTLVNAERFITPELKEKEELIFAAEEKINRLEQELYDELVDVLNISIGDILNTADLMAEIDLVTGLAELAVDQGYCRPELFENTRLVIEGGRHPVVESVLASGSFVANDLTLSTEQDQIIILTGPNMSGKSTYLRQIGLIVILAQIGSFVPADQAEIGLVDRVFTRVGAMDNLAGGQSTFLVEMVEAANILNNATEHSLVLLDEVGRGTSTFDGLSVAWSVVEHIYDHCHSRTVFATHYHELTGLAGIYERVHNFQVAVKKWEDRVVFLHKIIAGGCDDSYGIEVARLAGVPRNTIARAKQILKLLESGKFNQSELGRGIYKEKVQTSLFEAPESQTEKQIREADLENMTPVQAFEFLRKLREDLS